jgi:Transposase Tn5 dimerisation domain
MNEKQVIGLAGAVTQYRSFKPKKETRAQSLARNRESDVWGRIVDQVGSAPEGSQWIHVFDRGGDYFEAMCRVKLNKNDWVIRASKLNRKVINDRGEEVTLSEAIEEATERGTFAMKLRSTPRHAARTAHLTVSSCEVSFLAPSRKSPWLRQCPIKELKMRVVIAMETNPPKGNKAICWVILTSLSVACFDDAWKVLEYYEHRWMIEEYNRVAKSGCSIERHALRTAERLEAIIGLTSIIAVRLFQLKLIGRNQPEAKAATHVPSTWLQGLKMMRPKIKLTEMTVYEFFRQLAMLGGFLGRKHDGEPGWQTIWRGYLRLHQTNVGIELGKRLR